MAALATFLCALAMIAYSNLALTGAGAQIPPEPQPAFLVQRPTPLGANRAINVPVVVALARCVPVSSLVAKLGSLGGSLRERCSEIGNLRPRLCRDHLLSCALLIRSERWQI